MNSLIRVVVFFSAALVACSTAPGEPGAPPAFTPGGSTISSVTPAEAAQTYAGAGSLADAAGFLHSSSHSRFHLGTSSSAVREGTLSKVVGREGVFATNTVTGASRAIPNADSAAIKRPPLTGSAEVHNARVMEYFKAAGLPADQIKGAHVLTHEESLVPPASGPVHPTFKGYTTVITRHIRGIPVPDSFAAARFNADGDVVEEWVYWPTIPRKAIEEAKAIGARRADAVSNRAFLAGLPAHLRGAPGEVTIRHSDFADERGLQAFAAFDVHGTKEGNGGFRGGTHSFDINGRELIHPNRRPGAGAVDTPKRR